MRLKHLDILCSRAALDNLPEGKLLINTINAYSYNNARKDELFAEALQKGDVLIPDGASIVKACRWIDAKSKPTERIAGYDLFEHQMARLNERGGKVMFMGSSERVLELIRQRVKRDYSQLDVAIYSPPFRTSFTDEESRAIVDAINRENPDLLWIGMTAPKQEKWTYQHWNELNINCHVGTVGAVFDFFAGTAKRAPLWWQRHSLEWLYRLLSEPRRMWRRYIVGNTEFLWYMWKERRES